jgi:AraC-like DNA-binding protein
MDLSARHLRRRLKEVTRLSPAGFIRTRRLQHAAALLEDGADTVKDVASAVGYRDPSYFSRLFRETFGCPPTAYAERDDAPDASDITA